MLDEIFDDMFDQETDNENNDPNEYLFAYREKTFYEDNNDTEAKEDNTKNQNVAKYLDGLSSSEHNIIFECSRIYSFIKNKHTDTDETRRVIRNRKYNKFVTEIYVDNAEQVQVDAQEDKVKDKSIDDNKNTDQDKKNDDEHETEDEEVETITIPTFQFGTSFYYWKWFQNAYKESCISAGNYPSLKYELLNNRLCNITKKNFDMELDKAISLANTDIAKNIKAVDRGGLNEDFEVPAETPLSITNILCLTIYTNNDKLQYYFKKEGCRKKTKDEPNETAAERNKEISNWYKIFYETIRIFGTQCKPGNVFYHGLNRRLVFDSFTPEFQCPISATTSIQVASSFAGYNGIMLCLEATQSTNDVYFDVEWLSNYPNERERLFAQTIGLHIVNLYDQSLDGQSNKAILKSFALFEQIFSSRTGEYYMFTLSRESKQTTQQILQILIDNYLNNHEISDKPMDINEMFSNLAAATIVEELNSLKAMSDYKKKKVINKEEPEIQIPTYIQQLFDNLIQAKKSKQSYFYVMPEEYKMLSNDLKDKLITFSDTDSSFTLTPFVLSITDPTYPWTVNVEKIKLVNQYVWSLDEKEITNLKASRYPKYVQCKQNYIYKLENNQSISFTLRIMQSIHVDNKALFDIIINKLPSDLSSINMALSMAVDELQWCMNTALKYKLKEKGFWVFSVFSNDQIMGLGSSLTIRLAPRFY
eukprot:38730_1